MLIPRFDPPAGVVDFTTPEQRDAWSFTIGHIVDRIVLRNPGTQLYNPLAGRPRAAVAGDETARDLVWSAFPRRLVNRYGLARALEIADDLYLRDTLGETERGLPFLHAYRGHFDYCEWRVTRDPSGNIRKVRFTTESLEYHWALAQGYAPYDYRMPPPPRPGAAGDMAATLGLYQRHVAPEVRLEDITFSEDVHGADDDSGGRVRRIYARGDYNPWNRWNTTEGLLHVTMPSNTLQALIAEIAQVAVRRAQGGLELRDPTRLLGAMDPDLGGAGINDNAGMAAAGVVGALARAGAWIAVLPRPAIVMRELDTRGWELPRRARRPASGYFTVLRGVPGAALMAELEVPPGAGFSVSDIRIDGVPIRHGGQIAQCLTVGFGVSAMQLGTAPQATLPAAGYAVRSLTTGALDSFAGAPTGDARYEELFPAAPPPLVEPILDDDEIQGNTLAGFNKDHQWVIGLDIVVPALARAWLRLQAPWLSTTAEVAAYNAAYRAGLSPPRVAWFNLAFSAEGLRLLGAEGLDELDSRAFRQGIAARGPFPVTREPHVLVIVAADDPRLLPFYLGTAAEIVAGAAAHGLQLHSSPNGPWFHVGENLGAREHFGFLDGISQPAVRGRLSRAWNPHLAPRTRWLAGTDPRFLDPNGPEIARPGQTLIWPGEFVMGYPRQDLHHPRRPAPPRPCTPAWTRNGSFLTYLRFKQDVDAFQTFVATLAASRQQPPQLVAAQLVGRWPNGSPLVAHPNAQGPAVSDHFLFGDDAGPLVWRTGSAAAVSGDARGAACPFTAHIRKVNPRDDATEEGSVPATLRRRLLRRGITYGPAHAGTGDKRDRGLLFLAYQASIEEQFEFVWKTWMTDALRPAGPGGPDLLVSAASAHVQLLDGGYFFAPSISAISRLGGLRGGGSLTRARPRPPLAPVPRR